MPAYPLPSYSYGFEYALLLSHKIEVAGNLAAKVAVKLAAVVALAGW